MTIEKHKKTIATIFFVIGVLNLVGWISIGGWNDGDWMFAIYAIFFIITGWKIHNDTPGAKVFGIIAGILSIPSFPIGTIIGIYCLWYFILGDKKNL